MSLFAQLGLPSPDPSTLEAIGRGEFPRRPGGMDPRLARAIARAKVPTTPEEHERMWEKYWEYEQRNAEKAAAREASDAAVAAAKTAESQPRARQRQHRRRRPTGHASPSAEDGPEPSAPGRARSLEPPPPSAPGRARIQPQNVFVSLGPPDPEAVKRLARSLVERAAADVLARVGNHELHGAAVDGCIEENGGAPEAATPRTPRRIVR